MLARLFDPRKKGTITLTDKRAPGCGNGLTEDSVKGKGRSLDHPAHPPLFQQQKPKSSVRLGFFMAGPRTLTSS